MLQYQQRHDGLPDCAVSGCQDHAGYYLFSGNVAFAGGCSCFVAPPICHPCRSQQQKVKCKWCGCNIIRWTIRPKEDPSIWRDTKQHFLRWYDLRIRKNHKQQVARIAESWTRFVNLFGMNQSPTTTMQWLNTQMGSEPKLAVVYSIPWRVLWQRQSFVLKMMTVSFARTHVCKFLNESENRVLFQQSYRREFLPHFKQKMFAKILRYLISNIVHLHELSIDLHMQQ